MVLLILINYRNFIQLIFFHLISDLIKGVDSYNNFFSSPFGSFSEKSNSFFDYEGLQEGGGDNGGGGYASTNEYYYEDSYRHCKYPEKNPTWAKDRMTKNYTSLLQFCNQNFEWNKLQK